jgi:hypothetical protein
MKLTNRVKAKSATGPAKGGTAMIRRLVGGSETRIRAARKEARRQMVRARIAAARARAGGRTRAAGASKKAVGAAGAVGLAAGYFLDPASGRRRRNVARDRALGLMRRGSDNGETPAPNDQALAEGPVSR